MFNIGSGEILVILLVAMVVLGPDKLPEAARKIGKVVAEMRKITDHFQAEVRGALQLDQPIEDDARTRGEAVAATRPAPAVDMVEPSVQIGPPNAVHQPGPTMVDPAPAEPSSHEHTAEPSSHEHTAEPSGASAMPVADAVEMPVAEDQPPHRTDPTV